MHFVSESRAGDFSRISLLLVFGLSFLLASADGQEVELKKEGRVLLGFENDADLNHIKTLSSTVTLVMEGVSEGGHALKVQFGTENAYPNVNFSQEPASDFRGYGGIVFDVYNPGENTVGFGVRVDSSDAADGNGKNSRSGKGSIEGKQRATFIMPFGVDPSSLGMRALPGYGAYRSLGTGGTGPFDLGHVVTWQIFTGRQTEPVDIIVDNIRLVPGKKQDFKGIIDSYGQYSAEDWPGKIKETADFAKQNAAEEKVLAGHRFLPGMDKYGGWADGPQLKATGFFRVEKYRDKWAFVDPEGRLFLSFGPTTIGAGSSTVFSGREEMFMVSPDSDPLLAKSRSGKEKVTVDFLAANLERKYGADYKKAWFERTYERLPSWGLNTIGAFSSWETMNNGKVPYTVTIWPVAKHARLATGKEQVRAMDDPYDPKFAEDVAAAVEAQASRIKADPFCIGYFVGNEEHWGYFKGGLKSHYALVLAALNNRAADSPAKRALLSLLQGKYGEIAKLNSAWGRKYASWESLAEPQEFSEPFGETLQSDFSMMLSDLAEQYFRIVQAEIKKADPNHLYLGCRFAGYSPEVLAAAARFSDVLSFNVYRLTVGAKEWSVLDPFDKPVLIGEFHFGAPDRGVFDTGLVGVANQEERGKAYRNYVLSVLALPKFVGAHWFQYTDQPATGRPMDGENGNIGFVSITDTPYTELIEASRKVHGEMYPLRFGK